MMMALKVGVCSRWVKATVFENFPLKIMGRRDLLGLSYVGMEKRQK